MLPGFRFLFAAILLSTSILVFGLGAAALLRATHEQFVNNPSWRNGPQEQVFAQASEPAQPELAAFRAEPLPPSAELRDQDPTIGLPASGPEQVAALTPDAASEPTLATDAPADAPAKADIAPSPPTDTPPPVTQTATAETTAEVSEAAPTMSEASPTPTAPVEPQRADAISATSAAPQSDTTTAVAALADPATTAPQDPPAEAKAASEATDKQATKGRAHRAKKPNRIVRRPPPPPAPVQQTFNPFITQSWQQQPLQQQPAYAATTRTR